MSTAYPESPCGMTVLNFSEVEAERGYNEST